MLVCILDEVIVSERIDKIVYTASWFFIALLLETINPLCFAIASYLVGLELSLIQLYLLSLVFMYNCWVLSMAS